VLFCATMEGLRSLLHRRGPFEWKDLFVDYLAIALSLSVAGATFAASRLFGKVLTASAMVICRASPGDRVAAAAVAKLAYLSKRRPASTLPRWPWRGSISHGPVF
jgi:hypothetical protein